MTKTKFDRVLWVRGSPGMATSRLSRWFRPNLGNVGVQDGKIVHLERLKPKLFMGWSEEAFLIYAAAHDWHVVETYPSHRYLVR